MVDSKEDYCLKWSVGLVILCIEDGTPVPRHVRVILLFVDSLKLALRCRNM
jgi:hypothetical protein